MKFQRHGAFVSSANQNATEEFDKSPAWNIFNLVSRVFAGFVLCRSQVSIAEFCELPVVCERLFIVKKLALVSGTSLMFRRQEMPVITYCLVLLVCSIVWFYCSKGVSFWCVASQQYRKKT
jgi:hypothetical protein